MRCPVQTIAHYCIILFTSLCLIACSEPLPDATFAHHQKGIYAAEFSNQGQYLIISTVEKAAELWDMEKDKQLYTWTHQAQKHSNISAVAISGDGKMAATGAGQSMAVWSVKTGQSLGFWNLPGSITHLKLSYSGQYALVAYQDRSVQLIDMLDGRSVWKVIHGGYVDSIALSQDGKLALIGCDDHTATLWDIEDSEKLFQWEEDSRIRYVALSPKNKYAMISTPLQSLKIYELSTGKLHQSLKITKHIPDLLTREIINVSSARFSSDEKQLITGAPPRDIYVWDVATGHLSMHYQIPKQKVWKPTSAIVYATAFNQDQSAIIAEASNGKGYRWVHQSESMTP